MENNALNEMDRVDPNLRDEMLAKLFLDQMVSDFKRSKILERIDHHYHFSLSNYLLNMLLYSIEDI